MTAIDGDYFDLFSEAGFGTRKQAVTPRSGGATWFPLPEVRSASRFAGVTYPDRLGDAFFQGGGSTPVPVTHYYELAAVDSGVGRRSWNSTTLDFASAPSPVGSWDTGTLTVLSSW